MKMMRKILGFRETSSAIMSKYNNDSYMKLKLDKIGIHRLLFF